MPFETALDSLIETVEGSSLDQLNAAHGRSADRSAIA
jgi:hypothetical protein